MRQKVKADTGSPSFKQPEQNKSIWKDVEGGEWGEGGREQTVYVIFKSRAFVHQTFQISNHDIDRKMVSKRLREGCEGDPKPSEHASEKPNQKLVRGRVIYQ
jgi:hypothetical protein